MNIDEVSPLRYVGILHQLGTFAALLCCLLPGVPGLLTLATLLPAWDSAPLPVAHVKKKAGIEG